MKMKMEPVDTFFAHVYVGLKCRASGEVADKAIAVGLVQRYVDSVGLCVTVTDTTYLYTNGNEPGIVVGLINYPRFPSTPAQIKAHAIAVAQILMADLRQIVVSIVMPDETLMLRDESAL